MEEITIRERARLRKQRSRAKMAKKQGLNRFEISLNDQEMAALERGRFHRNPGRQPYSRNEYIALLLLNDAAELQKQEKATPVCKNCGAQPPENCNGAFKGDHSCWLTHDCLRLNLTNVTGHTNTD